MIAVVQEWGNGNINVRKLKRAAAAVSTLFALAACSNAGGLSGVVGSVLGTGPGGSQVSGYVERIDTRPQVIVLHSSSGQSVNIEYDDQTKVVYNHRNYPVASLDRGDQVTVRVQSTRRGYYTDLVQVDQPVQGSDSSTASARVQTILGTVRDVDMQNALFSLDVGSGTRVTVSMPYSPSRADQSRFQNLRQGDTVRIAGVYVNSSRVELRQFY